MITWTDSDANEMAVFLKENYDFLVKYKLLSQERYEAIIDVLNLMIQFAWDTENRLSWNKKNLKKLRGKINKIKLRIDLK